MANLESRFVAMVRHGELHNPTGRLYSRDSQVIKPEDIIHISNEGIAQMHELGQSIIKRKLKVQKIFSSPNTRAKESAAILSEELGGINVTVDADLDDVSATGPYLEGMTIEELARIGGNVYEDERWEKYNHEKPADAISRMKKVVQHAISNLEQGKCAILVSHGDSIAWYLNTLNGQAEPKPQDLRNLIYPAKGEATIIEVTSDGKMKILYTLPEQNTSEQRIY